MVPVSVAELKEHIEFLRAVHVPRRALARSRCAPTARAPPHGGAHVLRVARIRGCLRGRPRHGARHARAGHSEVAWIWHVHRLATVEYKTTCALLGVFVAPARGIGFATVRPTRARRTPRLRTRRTNSLRRRPPLQVPVADLGPGVQRRCVPRARDRARYERFVMLCAGTTVGSLSPPYDVDLVWHTHMLRGADYASESAAMCGGARGARSRQQRGHGGRAPRRGVVAHARRVEGPEQGRRSHAGGPAPGRAATRRASAVVVWKRRRRADHRRLPRRRRGRRHRQADAVPF